MPLRLISPNPYDRQVALLNLGMIQAMLTGQDFYVGICSCKDALTNGILIMSNHEREECVFCRNGVQLTRIPLYAGQLREMFNDETSRA